MKILNPFVHGLLDYAVVAGFALAPSFFEFSESPKHLAWILAGTHLAVTLLTRFPLGLIKLIPFPMHGVLEFLVSIAIIALPWVAEFSTEIMARNFYVGAGIVIILVVLVTDYRGASRARSA